MPRCLAYGVTHTSPCKMELRAYFVYGKVGHIARDCSHRSTQFSRGILLSTCRSIPSSSTVFMRLPSDQRGRSEGRGSTN